MQNRSWLWQDYCLEKLKWTELRYNIPIRNVQKGEEINVIIGYASCALEIPVLAHWFFTGLDFLLDSEQGFLIWNTGFKPNQAAFHFKTKWGFFYFLFSTIFVSSFEISHLLKKTLSECILNLTHVSKVWTSSRHTFLLSMDDRMFDITLKCTNLFETSARHVDISWMIHLSLSWTQCMVTGRRYYVAMTTASSVRQICVQLLTQKSARNVSLPSFHFVSQLS